MFSKKIMIIITNPRKKYLFLAIILVLFTVLLSTIILASHHSNFLYNKNIIIDPGHGGIDGGTNDGSTFLEKNINLQIAKKLQQVLKTNYATVDLTRESDISLDDRNTLSTSRHLRDLAARVDMFNSGKYDLFVSIHVNSSSNTNAIGPMVLYSDEIPSTALLADCIQGRLNEHIKNNLKSDVSHNPLVSQYFILKNSGIPGVIVETGFISNATEKSLLTDSSYQTKIVNAVYEGIKDYYQKVDEINISSPGNQKNKDVSSPLAELMNK